MFDRLKGLQDTTYKIFYVLPEMYNSCEYNGSEPKCGVSIDDTDYILKRQKKNYNNVLSEYIASNVINALGGESHETYLANENGNIVVLCKNFCKTHGELVTLGSIGESSIDTNVEEHEYFFDDVVYMLSTIIKDNSEELINKFLEMYVFDTILGNPDRHENNWGVCKDVNGFYSFAPIFDNGSSLLPRADYPDITEDWIRDRVYTFPNSKVMFGNERKRSSYYEIWHKGILPDYAKDFARMLDIEKQLDGLLIILY